MTIAMLLRNTVQAACDAVEGLDRGDPLPSVT
jgi:hypothetical protein